MKKDLKTLYSLIVKIRVKFSEFVIFFLLFSYIEGLLINHSFFEISILSVSMCLLTLNSLSNSVIDALIKNLSSILARLIILVFHSYYL